VYRENVSAPLLAGRQGIPHHSCLQPILDIKKSKNINYCEKELIYFRFEEI